MKKRFIIPVLAIALMLALFSGCKQEQEEETEVNPDDFSYDMLDVSILVDEIYDNLEISELAKSSVVKATDTVFIEEQFYLDFNNVISYDIRYAEGNYGAADVAVIRVAEGKAGEVMDSLERRKDDRISEFRNYDVYDSYDIAMSAEIYQEGELVVMLMLSEDDKVAAKETITNHIP